VFAEKLCGKKRPSTKLVFRCSTQKTDYHSQVEWTPEFSSKKCISKRKPPLEAKPVIASICSRWIMLGIRARLK